MPPMHVHGVSYVPLRQRWNPTLRIRQPQAQAASPPQQSPCSTEGAHPPDCTDAQKTMSKVTAQNRSEGGYILNTSARCYVPNPTISSSICYTWSFKSEAGDRGALTIVGSSMLASYQGVPNSSLPGNPATEQMGSLCALPCSEQFRWAVLHYDIKSYIIFLHPATIPGVTPKGFDSWIQGRGHTACRTAQVRSRCLLSALTPYAPR